MAPRDSLADVEGSGEGTDLVQIGTEILRDPAVQEFAGRVVGSPAAEAGELIADHVRFRRFKAELKMLQRGKAMVEEAGFRAQEIGPVDLTVLAPLFEGASLQSDDSMTDRFAALLANAATHSAAIPPSLPRILSELDPVDAAILDAMYDDPRGRPPPLGGGTPRDPTGWTLERLEEALGRERGSLHPSRLDKLVRLGLGFNPLEPAFATTRSPRRDQVVLSPLGIVFVSACRPPQPKSPPA